jgi:tryptophanyl-tRNA synthetase
MLSPVTRLPGIDGEAMMSKSLDNAIALGASADDIRKAVRAMYTDEQHLRASDPGRVEGNVVFAFLDAFEPDVERVTELKAHYRRGGLGDSVVKGILEERLQALLAPIRAERQRLAEDRGALLQILRAGTERAREKAAGTVGAVKRALGLVYFA